MHWIRTTLQEIFGLFVDDASFALAIVAWLVFLLTLAHKTRTPAVWQGPILFMGLALILIESVLRAARKPKK
jgi:hypothetical protein